jgi:hypothetical protein
VWRATPWLVSFLVPPNLFKPRIAKRFEAGAEEDRAVAQAIKLGCRLAPPSQLRLCEAESYPAQNLSNKKRAYKHVSNAGHPRKADASKERPKEPKLYKMERKQK